MSSRELTLLAEVEQIKILLDRIDSDLTPDAERQALLLAYGTLQYEAYEENLFELDTETLNRVMNAARVRKAIDNAFKVIEARVNKPSKWENFWIGFLSSGAATLAIPLLLGLLFLVYIIGKGASLENLLKVLQTF